MLSPRSLFSIFMLSFLSSPPLCSKPKMHCSSIVGDVFFSQTGDCLSLHSDLCFIYEKMCCFGQFFVIKCVTYCFCQQIPLNLGLGRDVAGDKVEFIASTLCVASLAISRNSKNSRKVFS